MCKNFSTYLFCSGYCLRQDYLYLEQAQTCFPYYGSVMIPIMLTKSIPYIFQNIFQETTDYF